MALKFIALSGTTGVTENLYIYEYGEDMIIVDCGVGFPEQDMLGVDLIIPDFTYIRENAHKLKAVVITHGHEDHIGAVPFLLKEFNVPVYSTKLVSGFIEDKFADHKIKGKKVNVFDPDRDVLTFGVFKVTPFRISHSVPDSVGFAIDTPEGRFFHVADFKFDWTPVDSEPFDIAKAAGLAAGGVVGVACDCLGATTPGYTESEYEIEAKIEAIIRGVQTKIFFTTISSNISRIQQAINVAQRNGRKVAFVGRSIESKSEIARNFGYLNYQSHMVVTRREAERMPKDKILFIVSGSYGQAGSNLYRLALNEHEKLSIEKGDVVIFSGDPAPPGTKASVDFIVDRLIELNANVHYYDMQEDLHVSGHGSQEDIKTLFALVKPKYFIPIGGTIRHMRAYKELALRMGAKENNIFEPSEGDIIEFTNGNARRAGNIPVKQILVDGLGIGDVGEVVLRDRQILSKDGIAIVIIKVDTIGGRLIGDPDIISRGFVFHKKEQVFLNDASQKLKHKIEEHKKINKQIARDTAVDFLETYFFHETGRRPMVLPLVVEA